MTFTTHSMQTILPLLTEHLKKKKYVTFSVINPDIKEECYSGTPIKIKNVTYVYRGYKTWIDTAEILKCKMLTPEVSLYPLIKLTFVRLCKEKTFHGQRRSTEKYGIHSNFYQINKMEETGFFYYYNQALENVGLRQREYILNLGINRGDKFQVIKNKLDIKEYHKKKLIGIDHSKSAIAAAKKRFPEKNVHFYLADINHLNSLKLGTCDLLISIGTLQSPDIHFKPLLMSLVQSYLQQDAALILGFPNARWLGGEVLYGAKAPNYRMSEMGIVFNDIIFAKKYLQQKKYRVTLTGKYYIFLTAVKIC